MSHHQIESFVNCDVAGFSAIETSPDGASWTTVSVTTGYVRFSDWLTAISAAVSGYVFAYDSDSDRVTITPSGSALYFRFTQSTAQLIGFASQPGQISVATTGTASPAGIVPAHGVSFLDSSPANRSNLRQYSQGRARAVTFGKGIFHRASIMLEYSELDRLLSGPCSTGRIRIGPSSASSGYSSTNVGGYIEAHVTRVGTPADLDDVEGVATLELGLHAATYTAPDALDPFFTSLERGYSLFWYCRIEGIPFVFSQGVDPGWIDENRATNTNLIVPDSTTVRYRIDRETGVAMSAPIQIGVLDPDNETLMFGKPSIVTEIDEPVTTAAQTTISAHNVTGWGSSGAFWLGKEYVRFTSVDAINKNFECVRSEINPPTLFDTGGGSAFTSITDRPFIWAGRVTELWCGILDAFGRSPEPSSGSWDNTNCRQMWTGEVAGTPGYDAGVWSIHCTPLIKRLTTDLASEGGGQIADAMKVGPNYVVSGSLSPLVVIDTDKKLRVIAEWSQTDDLKAVTITPADKAHPSGTGSEDFGSSGTLKICRYYDLILNVFNQLRGTAGDLLNPDPDNVGHIALSKWEVFLAEFIEDEGEPWVRSFRIYNGLGTLGQISPYLKLSIRPGEGDPSWWSAYVKFEPGDTANPPKGSGQYSDVSASEEGNPRQISTGATGKNIDSVVLSAGADGLNLVGSWPTSGYALLDGQELVSYTGIVQSAANQLVGLHGLTRGVDGTEPVNAWKPGLKGVAVQSLTGLYGEQMLTMIQSSGTATRGTYDTAPISDGYGIDDDHLSEASFKSAIGWNTTTLLADKTSFKKTFGTMLGGLRRAVSPIRDAQRLKMGLVRTIPIGSATVKLRDDDLRLEAPEVQRIGLGPNIVEINTSKAPGMGKGFTYTYRLLADIAARGGIKHSITIPGMDSLFFEVIAQQIGSSYMLSTMGLVAYKFKVGPHKDWLPGQTIDIDISHAGVWDFQNDQTGIDAIGVVLEVSRRSTGECELVVMVGGAGLPGALCPSALVTNRSGTTLTIDLNSFPDGTVLFSSGDPVLLYQAGVAGNYSERVASTVSAETMTINTVPAWMPAGALTATDGIYVTYPSDDLSEIKDNQDAFTHFADGKVWL